MRVHLSGHPAWVSLPPLFWWDRFFQLEEGSVRNWQGHRVLCKCSGSALGTGRPVFLKTRRDWQLPISSSGDVSAAFLGGCAHSDRPWQGCPTITFSCGWEGCQGAAMQDRVQAPSCHTSSLGPNHVVEQSREHRERHPRLYRKRL